MTTLSQQSTSHIISRLTAMRRIAGLALPMAISYTFSFSIVIIGIFASHLSTQETHIAAVALIMVLTNTLVIIGMSPLFAISIITSHQVGQLRTLLENNTDTQTIVNKRAYIANMNKSSLLVCLIALPIMLLMFFAEPLLTHLFAQDRIIASIVQDFLKIYVIAIPAIMARICFEQIMFSFAKVKVAMAIGLISLTIGTFLAYALGFGMWLFPNLGLTGIAIGFVIEAYITAIGYGLYIAWHKEFVHFKFFHQLTCIDKQTINQIKEIFRVGLPISFTISNEMAIIFVIGILAGLVGILELAAFNYAMQFVLFTFVGFAAFGHACCQEVSRELGAGKSANIDRIAKYGLLTTLLIVVPLSLLIAIYPEFLTLPGSGEADINIDNILKILMPIMALAVVLDAIRFNMLQVLRGLGDHIVSTTISTTALWLGSILAAILALMTSLGIYGVAIGYTAGFAIGTIGLYLRWRIKINLS